MNASRHPTLLLGNTSSTSSNSFISSLPCYSSFSSKSLHSQNMSKNSECSFEYDENMMIKMLYESVYYPNESSDYNRKSKSLNVDLKSGSINDELVNFDANMRKLLNPFVLIFFDKDQDFILEQLKVCANENLKNV